MLGRLAYLGKISRRTVSLIILGSLTAAVLYLFVGGYVHRASAAASRLVADAAADAGLTISTIHVSGNRNELPGTLYRALGVEAGGSIFSADPKEISARVKALPWVQDVVISRRYPDLLDIRIIERQPFGLWRSGRDVYVIDRQGEPITLADASRFRRLPLFFGEKPVGASDLVRAMSSQRAVSARVKAMQRVTDRRWNLILDDGVVVKLPEERWKTELAALERLIVENGVLERDISEIDLRSHANYVFVLRHPVARKNSRGEPT